MVGDKYMGICFLGGGNMATALIGGLIEHGTAATEIMVIEIDDTARERLKRDFQVHCLSHPDISVKSSDVIILAIKPQQMAKSLPQLVPFLTNQIVVSIAAGVRLADVSRWLQGYSKLVRAMPNLPALIGSGMTGLYAMPEANPAERERVAAIFRTVGQVMWVGDEARIDAMTALIGSGPAYTFFFIEALQEAAKQLGFSEEEGARLVIETMLGAIRMAAISSESVNMLRERVTSPGGTTAAALEVLNASSTSQSIVRAILAAEQRSRELGVQLGIQVETMQTQ